MYAETAKVETRVLETGRVQVRVVTDAAVEHARTQLRSERIEIEHVPVGREVSEVPPVREENGVTILPIVEEELVVVTRLILREEVHIRRTTVVENVERPVILRRQHAEIERLPPAESNSDAVPPVTRGDGDSRTAVDQDESRSGDGASSQSAS